MSQEAVAAEQAAIAAYSQQQRRRRMVLGIDVSKYAGFRTPGIDNTQMLSAPWKMLKDGEAKHARGLQWLWKKPDDPFTKSMVARQILRPVVADEIDRNSPYANVHEVKIITQQGPRNVIRTPGGLGLFEVKDQTALSNADKGNLPGDHWEHSYLSDLADQGDQFSADLEEISASSLQGRVKGGIDVKDTAREIVV